MECSEKLDYLKDAGVFALLTKLCESTLSARNGHEFGSMDHGLVKRMRSKSYEIILKKSKDHSFSTAKAESIMDMISYVYVAGGKQKNVQDFRNVDRLKKLVDWCIGVKKREGEESPFMNILQLLVCLKDSSPEDNENISFMNPFSFGKLDEMLPKPLKVNAGDPEPYQYFPSHLFELPFATKCESKRLTTNKNADRYASYDASVFYLNTNKSKSKNKSDAPATVYSNVGLPSFPRLTEPRDLAFGGGDDLYPSLTVCNIAPSKVSKERRYSKNYSVESPLSSIPNMEHQCHTHAIWEIVSTPHYLPVDIWETVSKMPPVFERNLIAASPNQMSLWKEIYQDSLHQLEIVTEVKLINHLMYLLLGIETSSFILDREIDVFRVNPGLCLEGLSKESLHGYLSDFLTTGTCCHRLNKLVSTNRSEGMLVTKGFIFEAMSDKLKEYLLAFAVKISEMFSALLVSQSVLPALLQILNELRPMRREIETIARVHKVYYKEETDALPKGANLMAYLYREVTLITYPPHSRLFYGSLLATCKVYFKFIQRFIFEGELDDYHSEFFITKDPNHIESPTKRYWDRGFMIKNEDTVPEFAKGLAEDILLCGKSFRLLKLCNPEDPLCILLSTEHPTISCCTTFDQIERLQKVMDVFRTRCLFVCGEPVTFREMLVRKEAERKAFSELAQVKHAETLQKIMEERKRLQRILNEEKLHCQQMLLKSAREAKEARQTRGARGRAIAALQDALSQAEKTKEDLIIEGEKKKMIEYYNELGQEVEKRKVRTEWKFKRLKLDEMRVQLLTSEERNFKREKIEQKYINSDDPMSQSYDLSLSVCDSIGDCAKSDDTVGDSQNNNLLETDVVLDNAVSESCLDNRIERDVNENPLVTSSLTVIDVRFTGAILEDTYLDRKSEAERNRLKVLNHEFGSTAQIPTESKVVNCSGEAETNRIKALGSKWMTESDVNQNTEPQSQFNTEESRQALKNKQRVLNQEFALHSKEAQDSRLGLTLDLERVQKSRKMNWKTLQETRSHADTPMCELNTPSDVFHQLDLETPTTCDVGLLGDPPTNSDSPDQSINMSLRHRVSTDGFVFPSLIIESPDETDEDPDDTIVEQDLETEVDATITPLTEQNRCYPSKSSVWNFTNRLLNFDSFVTCGLKGTDLHSDRPFTAQMMADERNSFYTPIEDILNEAQKKPMDDLFSTAKTKVDEDECDVSNTDFSTLSACLRRSIMIPLTYQMEMVNNAVLKYFLVDLDLHEHLKSLCDCFFLMDAEFSSMICKGIFKKLKCTNNPQELLNYATLHNMLDKAFGASIAATKFSGNLSFTVTDPPISFQHSSPDVLQCLTLSYCVPWPLNIILSPEAICRYGRVFQFLLKMRRVSWVIAEDFGELKQSLKEKFLVSRDLLRSPQYHTVQIYRHSMASMIRALDTYIITTCIQSSWKELERDLMDVHTLDALYSCHVVYIKNVLFKCLLNKRSVPLMKVLNELFSVVLKFHHTLNARCWHIAEGENDYTHPLFHQLKEQFIMFEKLARYLHKITLKLTERGYQPHLLELLTMININNFYVT